VAGNFLNLKVEYLGCIFEDQVVQKAVLKQKPFMVIDPKAKASQCVQHLVGKMEKIESSHGVGFSGMMRRLFERGEH
jgi:flagellar biosynthesis protein FlhG